MQTRSKTDRLKMEEAARILISLSQQPPRETKSLARVPRTLSYENESFQRAMKIAPRTKSGDTILMNFYIEQDLYTTVKYMKNDEGAFKTYTIRDHYDNIKIPWTYQVTDFPFYKEDHPIPFAH